MKTTNRTITNDGPVPFVYESLQYEPSDFGVKSQPLVVHSGPKTFRTIDVPDDAGVTEYDTKSFRREATGPRVFNMKAQGSPVPMDQSTDADEAIAEAKAWAARLTYCIKQLVGTFDLDDDSRTDMCAIADGITRVFDKRMYNIEQKGAQNRSEMRAIERTGDATGEFNSRRFQECSTRHGQFVKSFKRMRFALQIAKNVRADIVSQTGLNWSGYTSVNEMKNPKAPKRSEMTWQQATIKAEELLSVYPEKGTTERIYRNFLKMQGSQRPDMNGIDDDDGVGASAADVDAMNAPHMDMDQRAGARYRELVRQSRAADDAENHDDVADDTDE